MALLNPITGLSRSISQMLPKSLQFPTASSGARVYGGRAIDENGGVVTPLPPYAPGDPVGKQPTNPMPAPTPPITYTPNPPAATGGGGGGDAGAGGGDPSAALPLDFKGLLESDPLYQQAKADAEAQRVEDLASRAAARQRSLILFGEVPDFASAQNELGLVGADIGGDITDTIKQLAQKNTAAGLSTTARLSRAYTDAVKQTKDNLTARGILYSGETGFQLGRRNDEHLQADYDARQQLVDYLAGVQTAFVQSERARQANLYQALLAAAGRIKAPPSPTTRTPMTPTAGPPTSGPSGTDGGNPYPAGSIPASVWDGQNNPDIQNLYGVNVDWNAAAAEAAAEEERRRTELAGQLFG